MATLSYRGKLCRLVSLADSNEQLPVVHEEDDAVDEKGPMDGRSCIYIKNQDYFLCNFIPKPRYRIPSPPSATVSWYITGMAGARRCSHLSAVKQTEVALAAPPAVPLHPGLHHVLHHRDLHLQVRGGANIRLCGCFNKTLQCYRNTIWVYAVSPVGRWWSRRRCRPGRPPGIPTGSPLSSRRSAARRRRSSRRRRAAPGPT